MNSSVSHMSDIDRALVVTYGLRLFSSPWLTASIMLEGVALPRAGYMQAQRAAVIGRRS